MRTPTNERLGSDTAETPATAGTASDPARQKSWAKGVATRTCILTRQTGERGDLLRLAISPDGDVLPDPLAKAPGRGAWLGVPRAQLETALAKGHLKGALARAFKGAPITISDDLPGRIERALANRHLRPSIAEA